MKQSRKETDAWSDGPQAQEPPSAETRSKQEGLGIRGKPGRRAAAAAAVLIAAIAGFAIGFYSFWADPKQGAELETRSWHIPQLPAGTAPTYKTLYDEGVAAVARVLEAHPNSPHSASALAVAYYLAHDTRGEAACWERCLEVDPTNNLAYSRLFALAEQEANYQRIVDLAQKAEARDPQNTTHRGQLGSALMHLQRTGEARSVLERHIREGRGDAEAYQVLGEVCYELNDPRAAKRYFEAAAAMAPYDAAMFYGLARACTKLGEDELAKQYRARFQELKDAEMAAHKTKSSPREQVRDAVHIPIRVAEIMRHVGRAYGDNNELDLAEQCWLRAAELSPEEMEARQLLSNLYDRQGRLDESLKWVRNLEQLDPENTRHIRNEGLLLSRLKRYDEAEKLFRELIRREPSSSFHFAALAELLLLRGGDKAEAASLAIHAVDIDPSGPNLFLLATVAQQSGDVATAKKAITLALARDPDNPQYKQLSSLISNRP